MSYTPFEHLGRLCWNATIWFGEWPAATAARRLKMCRDMTEMYLEFRKEPRESAEPWVWETIEALHVDLAGLIAESLPPEQHKTLMDWMHGGIAASTARAAQLQKQLDECPF